MGVYEGVVAIAWVKRGVCGGWGVSLDGWCRLV